MIQQHLRRPTAMPYGTNLHVFREGVQPVWEDPHFKEGCSFAIKSQKFQSSKYWEDLLLAMLGEQFETPDFVMGVVLKLRPQFDKIDIWLKDSTNEEQISSTRSTLLQILQVQESELEYYVFSEVKNKAAQIKQNKPFKKFKKDEGPIKRADNAKAPEDNQEASK